MIRVKICGITNLEDALHAVRCGADALGFVFYEKSPRAIAPEQARQIIAALPPFVDSVGLFVNEAPETVRKVADLCHLSVIQLHGDEAPGDCLYPPYRVIKALRVKDASVIKQAEAFGVSGLLLDAWVEGAYGGTGHQANWQVAAQAARRWPVILAGGLTPENVQQAIRQVRPYAVDVSSGVESAPGQKDHNKVAEFIRRVKEEVAP